MDKSHFLVKSVRYVVFAACGRMMFGHHTLHTIAHDRSRLFTFSSQPCSESSTGF